MPKRKILVIDDNALLRNMVKQLLTRDGHIVLDAKNGPIGLALARTEKPDLILLDLMMPSMSGEEVAKFLHYDPDLCSIPVVVLTSVDQPKYILSLVALGVRDYVLKPPNAVTLRSRIRAVLEPTPPAAPDAEAEDSSASADK